MKHAYLIIAHNEWEVLRYLLTLIDDARNDVFIHFDKKVKNLPVLHLEHAGLFVLQDRVSVSWADVSMVEAELRLFEEASLRQEYAYYHLISGVDLPLRSQNEIHNFFDQHKGKEFIGYYQGDIQAELVRRVQRWHLFPKDFRESRGGVHFIKRLLRFAALQLQSIVGWKRNQYIDFKKGTQWVSLTHSFVQYLLSQKSKLLVTYAHTFCADEVFVQTVCWNSPYRSAIYCNTDEAQGCMRFAHWKDGEILINTKSDIPILLASPYLFGRKFSEQHIDAVMELYSIIMKRDGQ